MWPHTCFQGRDTIKHFPENEFFANDCIFFKTLKNPLSKTHECFICKLVYQLFLSPQPCSLPKHSCPILLGKDENCYRTRNLLLRVLEVVISASQFCLRCTMFKVKHGWDPYTLYARKCFFTATWKIHWFQSLILCFNVLPNESKTQDGSSKNSGRNEMFIVITLLCYSAYVKKAWGVLNWKLHILL